MIKIALLTILMTTAPALALEHLGGGGYGFDGDENYRSYDDEECCGDELQHDPGYDYARGRTGSHRFGGYTSHGRGSHYYGGH